MELFSNEFKFFIQDVIYSFKQVFKRQSDNNIQLELYQIKNDIRTEKNRITFINGKIDNLISGKIQCGYDLYFDELMAEQGLDLKIFTDNFFDYLNTLSKINYGFKLTNIECKSYLFIIFRYRYQIEFNGVYQQGYFFIGFDEITLLYFENK